MYLLYLLFSKSLVEISAHFVKNVFISNFILSSFRERVALLKGLDESVMQEIAENLPITEGVDRLMYVLKKYGYKIAILSGGFTYFGQYLQKKYGIDYVYANELEIN